MASKRNDKKAAAGRDDVIRAGFQPGVELRDMGDDSPDQPLTMSGHLAVFNTWTQINSPWEGNFMEQIAPGAFTKTINENRQNIKVLYDHGMGPLGNLPLGPIKALREDGTGCYFEVELLDANYVQELVPALRAGLMGSSFRFQVIRDEWNDQPKLSADNPKGLPERTIREVNMAEFGCVTFPAYKAATAGVRSRQEFSIWRDLDEQDRAEFAEFLVRARFSSEDANKASKKNADGDGETREEITINVNVSDLDPAALAAEITRALEAHTSSARSDDSGGDEEIQDTSTSDDEAIDDTEPDGAEDAEAGETDAADGTGDVPDEDAAGSTDDAPAEEPPADRSKTTQAERKQAARRALLINKGIIS